MKCLRVAQLLRDAGERLSPTNRTKCCVTNANSETFYSVFLFSTYVLPVKKACDVWINLDFMEISGILWPVQVTGEWTTVFSYVTGVINCLSRSFTTIASEKRKKILHLYIFYHSCQAVITKLYDKIEPIYFHLFITDVLVPAPLTENYNLRCARKTLKRYQ